MNQKALEGLKTEEERKQMCKDTFLHIKDLEAELEHFHVRESHEVESIARIEKHIDDLYEELEKLQDYEIK